MMSELMTVAQVAEILNCAEETVTRRFAREKGVIDLGSPGNLRKRRYRVLRIPKTVVEKYVLVRGGRITVEPAPAKPRPSKAKPAPTEDDIIHDLATLASQRGAEARKTVERIARQAKAMSYVPTDEWQNMVFFDDEDE
jgi:hypothetical protein